MISELIWMNGKKHATYRIVLVYLLWVESPTPSRGSFKYTVYRSIALAAYWIVLVLSLWVAKSTPPSGWC